MGNVFCDENAEDSIHYMRVDWYPGGNLREFRSKIICPEKKWFMFSVSISNAVSSRRTMEDTGIVVIDLLSETDSEWQTDQDTADDPVQFQDIDTTISLYQDLEALVNSLDIAAHGGEEVFDTVEALEQCNSILLYLQLSFIPFSSTMP
jgi:hypothetical protein